MLDFISVGGATRDIFLNYDDLKKHKDKDSISGSFLMVPYGEKLVSRETYYSYGGGAVNISVAMARLGIKAAPICNIGLEGTGSLIKEMLRKEKVNTSMVKRDRCYHTGLSIFILGSDNEHTGFLERGANDHLKLRKVSKLSRANWIYITSLTGDSAKLLPIIFDYAERKNLKICFNPGSDQLAEGFKNLEKYIRLTEILALNMDEAEKLALSKTGKKYQKRRNLFAEIEKMGARISVVTDGAFGSYAIVDGKVYSQPACKTEVVDTTGAGDSFGSTFSYGIYKGFDIKQSLRMAAVNSASVVSKMGAQDGLLSYNGIKNSKWL